MTIEKQKYEDLESAMDEMGRKMASLERKVAQLQAANAAMRHIMGEKATLLATVAKELERGANRG